MGNPVSPREPITLLFYEDFLQKSIENGLELLNFWGSYVSLFFA